jgi:hypothetical protein
VRQATGVGPIAASLRTLPMPRARLRYDSGPTCKAARRVISGTGKTAPALLHNRQAEQPEAATRPPRTDGANTRKTRIRKRKVVRKNEAHHIAHSGHKAHSVPGARHSPAHSPHA